MINKNRNFFAVIGNKYDILVATFKIEYEIALIFFRAAGFMLQKILSKELRKLRNLKIYFFLYFLPLLLSLADLF